MSLLNRRNLLLALPIVAAACGFTPVYGPGGSGNALYGQIELQAPEEMPTTNDVDAYLLVRNLEERLGRTSQGAYRLELALDIRSEGQAITAENEITRYSVLGRANYTLTRQSDGVVVSSGTAENFTGYSATGSTVETLAGERDAHQRLMQILSDQISTRILTTAELSGAAPA